MADIDITNPNFAEKSITFDVVMNGPMARPNPNNKVPQWGVKQPQRSIERILVSAENWQLW